MWSSLRAAIALVFVALSPAIAQRPKQDRDEDFATAKPAVGDLLADLSVYSPDGTKFKTSDLRGKYAVLTFGCLT